MILNQKEMEMPVMSQKVLILNDLLETPWPSQNLFLEWEENCKTEQIQEWNVCQCVLAKEDARANTLPFY